MNPSKHRLYKAVQACKAKEIQALVQQYKGVLEFLSCTAP